METKTKSSKRKIKGPEIWMQLTEGFKEESLINSLKEETIAYIENPYDDSFIDCVDYTSKGETIRIGEGHELMIQNEMSYDSDIKCANDNNLRRVRGLNSYTKQADWKQDDWSIRSWNYIEKTRYKMMLGEKINKSKLNSFENLAHLSLENLIPIAREVKNYFIKRDLGPGITEGLKTQERFSDIYKQVLTDLIDISIDYVTEDKGAYRLINQKFSNPIDLMDIEGRKLYVSAFSKFINLENERRSKLREHKK